MAEPAITQDEQRLKQRAMRRLAIALTLIAAAIVALALLDRYNASLRKSEPVSAPPRETPQVLPRPPTATPSTPPPSSEEQAKRPPPPPPPVVSNQELPSEPSPATPESAEKKPAAPTTPAKPPTSAERPTAPAPDQKTAPAVAQKPAPAPEQKLAPLSPTAKPSAPSAAPTPSETTPSNKGFLVQVGVFMSAANARKLQEKLAEKGIPTHTETRIVVGPFKDRAEADAVTRQLKEMGMDGVVIAPPGTQ
jgi:DedD protein